MKPVPFTYHRAGSVAEACALLADDPESRLIAGGQTLMPMLAMRLARPTRVIDISRIPDLIGITLEESAVVIGAATRQHMAEESPIIDAELPLLGRALPWIGHAATRRMGTIGGSIANADPAAEIALVAVTLGAELVIGDADGSVRQMPVSEFILAPMVTALPPTAMIVAVRFPRRARRERTGVGFFEMSNRRSDYALASAAVELMLDAEGRCLDIAVGIGGAAEIPSRLNLTGLHGRALAKAELTAALTEAVATLPLLSDHSASAAYRGRIAVAVALRAIELAQNEAAGSTQTWN